MGKRVNYGFEKRQRELRKQKKKAEKAERKRLEAEAAAAEPLEGASDGEAAETDLPERD
jgi:hypothetical protein